MIKYIDAEHFRRWVIARWEERDTTNPYPLSGREILEQIEREEYFAADVQEVKHGRWRKERVSSTGSGSYGVYQCSICGAMFPDIGYGYNYCPNCGSRMDLGGDTE